MFIFIELIPRCRLSKHKHQYNCWQTNIDRLLTLKTKLKNEIPEKHLESNLIIASWNIREFDSPAYGDRVDECFYYIAEIISKFDIIAVQEVRQDLKALNKN